MIGSISWLASIFLGNTICYPLDNLKSHAQCNLSTKLPIKELFNGYRYFIANIMIARFLTFKSYITLIEYTSVLNTVFMISIASSLVSTPFERLKILDQLGNKTKDYRTLFRGYSWAFARDFTSTGFYFPLYFYLRENKDYPAFANGFIAGCASKLVSHPFDTIKTIRQSDIAIKYTYKHLFRGITYETIRTGMGSLIIFSTYEYLISKAKKMNFTV